MRKVTDTTKNVRKLTRSNTIPLRPRYVKAKNLAFDTFLTDAFVGCVGPLQSSDSINPYRKEFPSQNALNNNMQSKNISKACKP